MKKANKKRTVTGRRVIIFLYLKASIDDLIALLSSSVQNSERGGDGDGRSILTGRSSRILSKRTKENI